MTAGGMVFTEGGKELFGLDAELYQKKQAKRDMAFETELISWMEKVTDRLLSSGNVRDSLRDGTHLCLLLNCAIRPGLVKFVVNPAPGIGEMDNIRVFLHGCKRVGVNPTSLFDPHDLLDGNDMGQVMMCLADVARVAQRRTGYTGPLINVNSPRSAKRVHSNTSPPSATIVEEEEQHTSPVVFHVDTTTPFTPTKKWAPVQINEGFRRGVTTRDLTPVPPLEYSPLPSPDPPPPTDSPPPSPLSWVPSQFSEPVQRRTPEPTATTPLNPTGEHSDSDSRRTICPCNIL